jgi:hypothetical protein
MKGIQSALVAFVLLFGLSIGGSAWAAGHSGGHAGRGHSGRAHVHDLHGRPNGRHFHEFDHVHGHHVHHHGHVHTTIGIGFGFWDPWWGFPPAYYPAYYPSSVVVVPYSPPVYIEKDEQEASASNWWYYCANPRGYYPYVNECTVGWQKVSPQPPSP